MLTHALARESTATQLLLTISESNAHALAADALNKRREGKYHYCALEMTAPLHQGHLTLASRRKQGGGPPKQQPVADLLVGRQVYRQSQ